MTLELNEQEAAALLELINIATKAGGLVVARNAVHFDQKIGTAIKAAQGKPDLKVVEAE